MLDRDSFGPHLRELRMRAGLTQAIAARHAGVHRGTWQRWERGGMPYLPRAGAIARALQIPVAALVDEPNGKTPIADLYLSEEQIARVRKGGQPELERAAEQIAAQAKAAIRRAAMPPPVQREPFGPKPRPVAREVRVRLGRYSPGRAAS